jgi:hypothetical protein
MDITLLTSSIDTLLEGFLADRSVSNEFVLKQHTATGWDIDREYFSDSLYSEEPKDKVAALKMAYKLCLNRVKISIPRKVSLTFDPERSCTDGESIFVGTKVMDTTLPFAFRLDVLLGLTTHEVGHCLHTDFSIEHPLDTKLYRILHNLIEDERLERIVSLETPGFSRYLQAAKKYHFSAYYKPALIQSELGEFGELFCCLFDLIRYPSGLDEELVSKHLPILMDIKKALTPYPVSNEDCVKASVTIHDILKEFAEKEAEKEDDANAQGGDDPSEKAEGKMDALADKVKALSSPSSQADNDEKENHTSDSLDFEAINEIEGETMPMTTSCGNGVNGSVRFLKTEENKQVYVELKKDILGACRSLAMALRVGSLKLALPNRGLREGTFDEAKIVDAIIGSPTVFYQKAISKVKSLIPVVLMIDESGSMRSFDKINSAIKVAIMFNEALKGLPVEFYAYGFTSNTSENRQGHDITVYCERGYQKPYSFGSIYAKASNADGVCIREVAARVRRFTKEKALLFVISDGQPASSYYIGSEDGILDTANAVSEVTKLGFTPIQIGIGVDESIQERMFNNFVNFDTPQDMVKGIGKLLKGNLKIMR